MSLSKGMKNTVSLSGDARHYRFAFRRKSGKLHYVSFWSTHLVLAMYQARTYADDRGLTFIGFRSDRKEDRTECVSL